MPSPSLSSYAADQEHRGKGQGGSPPLTGRESLHIFPLQNCMLQPRAKALAPLPLLAALVSLSACQVDPPFVHERFAELRPARVAVPPVVNRTLRDLRHVSTAALLQRVTLGAGAVDVLAVLDEALREGLAGRGYEVVDAGASPPSAGGGGGGRAGAPGASDAVLECEVNDFAASSASTGGNLEIAGEVAL